jgi:hypothetical protein
MSAQHERVVTSFEEAFADEDVPEEVKARFRDAPFDDETKRCVRRFAYLGPCVRLDGSQGRINQITVTCFNDDGSIDYQDEREWCG